MKKILICLICLCVLCACQIKKEIHSSLHLSIPKISRDALVKEDREDYLFLEVYKIDSKDFQEYMQACKEWGYIVDVKESDLYYNAFDEEGKHIVLYYFPKQAYYSLEVYESKIQEDLVWKKMNLLPEPKVSKGKIEKNTEQEISAYFKMNQKEYESYVESCKQFGYNQEPIEEARYYYAKDKAGANLYMSYMGADTVSVTLVRN
ncbi:MAG: hypothetical protein KBT48_07055 [Firmicutes bacterium]|nr:hypothetical protein [Bacillota bacterium]